MLATYLNENKQRFLDELFELIRIPSVSADSKFKADVQRAAAFVCDRLSDAGLDGAEVIETPGHPIV
ncbi:MAG TPA: peptidase dimerization domain protein, partial [Fibrella sp.]